jgi:hypothetical protein
MNTLARTALGLLLAVATATTSSACSSSSSSGTPSASDTKASPSATNGSGKKTSGDKYPPCTKAAANDALAAVGAPVLKINGQPTCSVQWAAVRYTLDGTKAKASDMLQAKNGNTWKVVSSTQYTTYCMPGQTTVPSSVTSVVCPT